LSNPAVSVANRFYGSFYFSAENVADRGNKVRENVAQTGTGKFVNNPGVATDGVRNLGDNLRNEKERQL
jgi:hypothetical protein